jgi:hypothetical protein
MIAFSLSYTFLGLTHRAIPGFAAIVLVMTFWLAKWDF